MFSCYQTHERPGYTFKTSCISCFFCVKIMSEYAKCNVILEFLIPTHQTYKNVKRKKNPQKKPNQKKKTKNKPTKTWLWIGRIIKCCLQQYLYTKSGTRWLIDTFIYLLIGNFSLPEFFFLVFEITFHIEVHSYSNSQNSLHE